MKTNKEAIKELEEFRKLLSNISSGYFNSDTRSKINQMIPSIRNLNVLTGTHKTVTISPPPATGGYLIENADPYNLIFNSPYDIDLVPTIKDMIDNAIGVLKADPDYLTRINGKTDKTSTSMSKNTYNKVFIVHGRNNELKESVARFIEELGFEAIILNEQTNGGRTIIEKFEEYSNVNYAIVLMTPDDKGGLISDNEMIPRARQNVIFELGYFIGKLGRNCVTALHSGDIEVPTDILGITYILVDQAGAWKYQVAKEMGNAGYQIDMNLI